MNYFLPAMAHVHTRVYCDHGNNYTNGLLPCTFPSLCDVTNTSPLPIFKNETFPSG